MDTIEYEDRVQIFDSWINSDERNFDRYTAILEGDLNDCIAMSEFPFHPQGFGQHTTVHYTWADEQVEMGREVSLASVPVDVQRCIIQDLKWIDNYNLTGKI